MAALLLMGALGSEHPAHGQTVRAPSSGASYGAQMFTTKVQPILEKHCFDCHGRGQAEGNLTLDHFTSPEDALKDPELWWRVVKNLRAGVMPPAEASKLSSDEMQTVRDWIKFGPFQIDPNDVDPGPITVRRLNRAEYGNTMRELMGVRFDEKLIFPPDDSGHGFDNVGDALMVSPLLLEKYLQAADLVVDRAAPKETWIVPRQDFRGSDFQSTSRGSRANGRSLDGKRPATVAHSFSVEEQGNYQVQISIKQHGSFEFDPARYQVTCRIDGQQRFQVELGWDENKRTDFQYTEDWESGEHELLFQLEPLKSKEDGSPLEENNGTSVRFELDSVRVEGPLGTERRVHPANYERFFHRKAPPESATERRAYANEVLARFATRAFRGEAPKATLERLTRIAEQSYSEPGITFEQGVGRAMVAALVSPRFLFRVESPVDSKGSHGLVDELSLASRLSYFLWSSMPDDELFRLAEAGKLRAQLDQQVDRMLDDPRSNAFVSNFVGQWLRTRDVAESTVDPAVVIGVSDELEELREWFRSRFRRGRRRGEMSAEGQAKLQRFREIREQLERYDDDWKRSVRQETERFLEHVVRSDVSLLDVLDSDYTFLNEKLASHYGIDGVKGSHMRRVKLPDDSPRGGVLTQASMLMVTSNPTRTSPVKRGLFVLENILGVPAPPAPGVVPELEESADRFEGKTPSLRELLEVHRESDLCASCHARMDPIGLALENFDALGQWRERDGDSTIDPQGQLVTGETFDDVRSLKATLREQHAEDFYRCVSEKLFVFAIGRGVEAADEHTIDLIVEQLDESGGKFRELVRAVVASAPFQKQRTQ